MIVGTGLRSAFSLEARVIPFRSGIAMSRTAMSGLASATTCRARAPLVAVATTSMSSVSPMRFATPDRNIG